MKLIEKIIQLFIGSLFIFSGVVKVNDPVGTAIKLEEYFAVFSKDIAEFFQIFVPYSLPLAIILVTLEIVLGVALLINFRKKDTIKALFVLIIFFTFLTFYSAYFNKVTDCGCFGDAIPLNPWQSFTKDMILLVLILVLMFRMKNFDNKFNLFSGGITGISAVLSLIIAFIAIEHLPFKDFRVYKVGASIPELMSAKAPCNYIYFLEKDGKMEQFSEYPSDPDYVYKDMKIANEEECTPKVTDYNLSDAEGNDQTAYSLEGKKFIIIVHKIEKTNAESFEKITAITEALEKQGVTPMIFSSDAAIDDLRHEVQLAAPYYFADATVLKTMIRSNPGLIYMEDGVIQNKWHYNDTPENVEQVLGR